MPQCARALHSGSGVAGEFHDADAEDRELPVLIASLLFDVDQMPAILDALAGHLAGPCR